jgi:hypothetical protein
MTVTEHIDTAERMAFWLAWYAAASISRHVGRVFLPYGSV